MPTSTWASKVSSVRKEGSQFFWRGDSTAGASIVTEEGRARVDFGVESGASKGMWLWIDSECGRALGGGNPRDQAVPARPVRSCTQKPNCCPCHATAPGAHSTDKSPHEVTRRAEVRVVAGSASEARTGIIPPPTNSLSGTHVGHNH